VVGAGEIAEAKIASLLVSGARVRVVAPQAQPAIQEWARIGEVQWELREFKPADLEGVFLVIAASDSSSLNATVFQEARKHNALCNAVDDPENCDFYYPAVVRRGDLQIAVSTAGHSPALAQHLRQQLEELIGPEYSAWVESLGDARQQLFARDMDPEVRRRLLHELVSRGPAGTTAREVEDLASAAKETVHVR